MKSLFFSRVFLKKKGVPEEFEVEATRLHKSFILLKLQGVDTIESAFEFVGEELFYPEQDLEPLDEGDYYIHQLLDCVVYTKSGEQLGLVHDVLPVAENDLLVVRGGDREFLIPLTATICFAIDLAQKRITIDPPEGLLDLNEI